MFGSMGLPELLVIFVVALLLFGPRKLPEIGKTLGKAMNEFKRASNDLKRSLEEEIAVDELKRAKREIQETAEPTPILAQPMSAPAPAVATPVPPPVADQEKNPEPTGPR